MKVLKVIFMVILVLIIVFAAVAYVFIRNFDINTYKTQITQEITKILGRKTSIGNIGLNLSLSRGLIVDIKDFKIADDTAFSSEEFLNIGRIYLSVDVEKWISKRQVLISDIEIMHPQVNLIKSQDGVLNAESFLKKNNNAVSASIMQGVGISEEQRGAIAKSSPAEMLLALVVKSSKLENGVIHYADRSFSPPLELTADQIDLRIKDFELNRLVDFSLSGSVFSSRKNIAIEGKLNADIRNTMLLLEDIKAQTSLSDLSLEQLRESLSFAEGLKLLKKISGGIKANAQEIEIKPGALSNLSVNASLSDGQVQASGIPVPINNIQADFTMNERDMRIKSATMDFASGAISLEGSIDGYLSNQQFDLNMDLKDIDAGALIPKAEDNVAFEGKIGGAFQVSGSGLDPKVIFNALKGQGNLEVLDGKLVNVNILKLVLSKISMLPRLTQKLEENLPEKYKEKLKAKDTAFKTVSLDASLQGRNLIVRNLTVSTDEFKMDGNGTMDIDRNLSFNTNFSISQELSQSMVKAQEELRFLLENSGEILIPVAVKGRIPELTYMPDLEYMGKRIIVQRGRQELEKVLNKVLKKNEEQTPEQTTAPDASQEPSAQGTQDSSQQQDASPQEQLIGNVLDAIFK